MRLSLLKLVKFSFLFFSYLLLVLSLQWIKIIIFRDFKMTNFIHNTLRLSFWQLAPMILHSCCVR